MTSYFLQADIDQHLRRHLTLFELCNEDVLPFLADRFLQKVAAAPRMHTGLDQLAAAADGVWTIIWGEHGPGRYPLAPSLLEVTCRCRRCCGGWTCEASRRSIKTYSSQSIAQSVATRRYEPGQRSVAIRLPRAVLETTSALLGDPSWQQADAFRTAVLLAT